MQEIFTFHWVKYINTLLVLICIVHIGLMSVATKVALQMNCKIEQSHFFYKL